MTFEELLGDSKLIVILRGLSVERTVELAQMVWASGAGLVEVPVQGDAGLAALAAAVRAGQAGKHPVGAGTVLSPPQAERARQAGAAFTVAPGFEPEVASASIAAGMPHVPGVATATEVNRALSAGCTWQKAFPASSLGTSWFRELRGPFPEVSFVATGGICAENAASFLAAGVKAIGVGSAATRPGALAELLAALV